MQQCQKESRSLGGAAKFHPAQKWASPTSRSAAARQCSVKRLMRHTEAVDTTRDGLSQRRREKQHYTGNLVSTQLFNASLEAREDPNAVGSCRSLRQASVLPNKMITLSAPVSSTRRQQSVAARVGCPAAPWRQRLTVLVRRVVIESGWQCPPEPEVVARKRSSMLVAGLLPTARRQPHVGPSHKPCKFRHKFFASTAIPSSQSGHPGVRRGQGIVSKTHLGPLSTHGTTSRELFCSTYAPMRATKGHLPSSNGNVVGVHCHGNFTKCMKNPRMISSELNCLIGDLNEHLKPTGRFLDGWPETS